MNLRPYWILAALLVGYVFAVLSGYFIWPGKCDAISAWAVLVTGGVVLWYTWETMRLRQAAYEQIEIQLRPFVVLEYLENQFQLRNLGPGSALNVKVSDVVIDIGEQITLRFPETIPFLPPLEVQRLTATSFHRGTCAGDFFDAHLDPRYAVMDLQVDVKFCNIEMKSYHVAERVHPGNLEILGISEGECKPKPPKVP